MGGVLAVAAQFGAVKSRVEALDTRVAEGNVAINTRVTEGNVAINTCVTDLGTRVTEANVAINNRMRCMLYEAFGVVGQPGWRQSEGHNKDISHADPEPDGQCL